MPSASAPTITRSVFKPAINCIQPSPSTPTSRSSPTSASVKNTSLTSAPMVWMGRISMPGLEVGTDSIVMP